MYDTVLMSDHIHPSTDEEIAFARMQHWKNIEFFRLEPFVLFSFSEFWDMTNGNDWRLNNAAILHAMLAHYVDTAHIASGPIGDETVWKAAVLRNREWIANLTDIEKAELQAFDNYSHWTPNLLTNDPISINGLIRLFPNWSDADATPPEVWRYENPNSPDKLPGAVDIHTHDSIHCLLGRGGLQADEAFVIGFTMGAASNTLTQHHIDTFVHAITHEYKPPYAVSDDYLPSYHIGVEAGRTYYEETGHDLSKIDFTALRDKPLHEVRAMFGIDIQWLSDIYTRQEIPAIPHKKAAQRMPGPVNPDRFFKTNPRLIYG